MKHLIRRRKHLLILVTLIFLLFINILISLKSFAPSTKNVTVTSDIYFTLPNGSEINFANGQSFNNFSPENSTGEWYWVFDNYKFQTQNANMTVTDYFTNRILVGGNVQTTLAFDLIGPTGTSTTKIVTDKGKPNSVIGASNWAYNETMNTLTINVTHASPQAVEVNWGDPSVLMALIETYFFVAFGLAIITPIILVGIAIVTGNPKLMGLAVSIIVMVTVGFVYVAYLLGMIA